MDKCLRANMYHDIRSSRDNPYPILKKGENVRLLFNRREVLRNSLGDFSIKLQDARQIYITHDRIKLRNYCPNNFYFFYSLLDVLSMWPVLGLVI